MMVWVNKITITKDFLNNKCSPTPPWRLPGTLFQQS